MIDMDYDEWLDYGVENGWIGPAVCCTHDGLPLTLEEEEAFEDSDPCIFVHRVCDGPEHQSAVEANHAPSLWRKG